MLKLFLLLFLFFSLLFLLFLFLLLLFFLLITTTKQSSKTAEKVFNSFHFLFFLFLVLVVDGNNFCSPLFKYLHVDDVYYSFELLLLVGKDISFSFFFKLLKEKWGEFFLEIVKASLRHLKCSVVSFPISYISKHWFFCKNPPLLNHERFILSFIVLYSLFW